MFIIEIVKGLFFSGNGTTGTRDKDQAVLFADQKTAQKYAKDIDAKVIVKKRKK